MIDSVRFISRMSSGTSTLNRFLICNAAPNHRIARHCETFCTGIAVRFSSPTKKSQRVSSTALTLFVGTPGFGLSPPQTDKKYKS